MSAQHEPRRAPTREEFIATLNRFRDLESDGDVILNNAIVEVDLIKAFDALAAERNEWKRRAEGAEAEAVRVAQVHQHEWLTRASAREAFENYVVRVMAASGADANFDDCFRNIIVEYDRVLALADKAEAERDAALQQLDRSNASIREATATMDAALEAIGKK